MSYKDLAYGCNLTFKGVMLTFRILPGGVLQIYKDNTPGYAPINTQSITVQTDMAPEQIAYGIERLGVKMRKAIDGAKRDPEVR